VSNSIQQKRRSYKQTFTFNDESLNVAYKSPSGYGDVDIPYEEIPPKPIVRINQHRSALFVGLAFFALAIPMTASYFLDADVDFEALFTLPTLSLLFIGLYWFTKVGYTVYENQRARFFVIQDRRHDAIVQEISTRRREQLRERYGEIDPRNDPAIEARKFKWLADQQAISPEEANEKLLRIEAIDAKPQPPRQN
jgi:hypothetical protein